MVIYTLTLNPAIDLFIRTNQMEPGQVNRTEYDEPQIKGKGVNGYATNNEEVLKSFLERESLGTTGMMDGFSIPHAKCGTTHLTYLSKIARMLMKAEFKENFIKAKTEDEIEKLFHAEE